MVSVVTRDTVVAQGRFEPAVLYKSAGLCPGAQQSWMSCR